MVWRLTDSAGALAHDYDPRSGVVEGARLSDAAKAYNPLLDRVSEGLVRLDRVYTDEHRAQESLIAEATLIQ